MAQSARAKNRTLLTEEEVEERRHILLAGIDQFNRGYFFEAHETWEDLWLPSPWPVRGFLQGLIQLAAAFVHLMRHEYPGTVRLLEAGRKKLAVVPAGYMGVDCPRLVAEARAAQSELAALGPDRFEEWDQRGIPRIHLVKEAARRTAAANDPRAPWAKMLLSHARNERRGRGRVE